MSDAPPQTANLKKSDYNSLQLNLSTLSILFCSINELSSVESSQKIKHNEAKLISAYLLGLNKKFYIYYLQYFTRVFAIFHESIGNISRDYLQYLTRLFAISYEIIRNTSRDHLQYLTRLFAISHKIICNTSRDYLQYLTRLFAIPHEITCNTSRDHLQYLTRLFAIPHEIICNISRDYLQYLTHGQLKLRPYFLPWVSKNRRYVSTIQTLFWILFTWILLFFNLNFTSY